MPLTTETTEDYQGIIHRGDGLVTGDDFLEACHSAFQLVQNTRNFHYEFIDLSEATEVRVSDEDLEQIAAQDRLTATYRPGAVVVVVAPRDDFYELGKTWERRVLDLGWSTHISREGSEARQWLKDNFPRPVSNPSSEIPSHSTAGREPMSSGD